MENSVVDIDLVIMCVYLFLVAVGSAVILTITELKGKQRKEGKSE